MEDKILTLQEFIEAEGVNRKYKLSEFSKRLLTLKSGEALKIERKGWKKKGPPHDYLSYLSRKFRYYFRTKTLADGSGWLVLRIK